MSRTMEEKIQYRRGYYLKNKEKILKHSKEYHLNNPNKWKTYQQTENYKKRRKTRGKRTKKKIIEHYGGKCVCCGETRFEFLTLDHINGGGNKERKKVGKNFYPYVIRNNFPDKYRLLCSNCNSSHGLYGYCPHEKEKVV